MKKNVRKAYFFAALISVVLYSIGVLSGIFIQKSADNISKNKMDSLKRSIENMQLEYFYLSSVGEKLPCDSLSILVDETTDEVRNIGKELVCKDGPVFTLDQISETPKEY